MRLCHKTTTPSLCDIIYKSEQEWLETETSFLIYLVVSSFLYCSLSRLKIKTRLLTILLHLSQPHHTWKDSIIGLFSRKRVLFWVVLAETTINEPRFELFQTSTTLNKTRLLLLKRELRSDQSCFHYLCPQEAPWHAWHCLAHSTAKVSYYLV